MTAKLCPGFCQGDLITTLTQGTGGLQTGRAATDDQQVADVVAHRSAEWTGVRIGSTGGAGGSVSVVVGDGVQDGLDLVDGDCGRVEVALQVQLTTVDRVVKGLGQRRVVFGTAQTSPLVEHHTD